MDFFEELDGVAHITSKNTPKGGDNIIPTNEDDIDISFLLKEEIELSIEEKMKLSLTRKEKLNESSKEEEYRDFDSKFSYDEIIDALNY